MVLIAWLRAALGPILKRSIGDLSKWRRTPALTSLFLDLGEPGRKAHILRPLDRPTDNGLARANRSRGASDPIPAPDISLHSIFHRTHHHGWAKLRSSWRRLS
jgi:hypothetical protein